MLNEVEFASTHRLWLETQVQTAVSGLRERQILQHIFTGPCLACRRLEGGIHLWNRAQMVSYTFCPKLDVPVNVWPADLIET